MGKPGFATGKSMLFFDWNGTLVNVNETFDKAFVRLVEDLAGRWTDYDRKEALRALEVYKQAWKENARRSRPRTYRQRFARSLKKALGDFPLPVDDAFAEQFHRRLKEEKKRSAVLLPDVADTLKELAERYRLGIISNGGGIDLAAAGLDLYFSPEDCITSREAGSRKPRKEIYESGSLRHDRRFLETGLPGRRPGGHGLRLDPRKANPRRHSQGCARQNDHCHQPVLPAEPNIITNNERVH